MLAALDEDRLTSWVPDVLAGVDDEELAQDALTWPLNLPDIETLKVPKPDGSYLLAPVLGLAATVSLHRAVDSLKDPVADMLLPGVCGYRRGSEAGRAYSAEHRRFVEMTLAETENSSHVVTADVKAFFRSTQWEAVFRALERYLPKSPDKGLRAFATEAQRAGLPCLPAGYADARFLANLVLHPVDAGLEGTFSRWVDDYRLFVSPDQSVEQSITSLSDGLAAVGLELNAIKTRIMQSKVAPERLRKTLDSVYHPDNESPAQVRTALRDVFLDATADPIGKRRLVRFCLPRLGAERDDVAVPWTLQMLPRLPWEAPRMIAYLSHFAERDHVQAGVEQALLRSLSPGGQWLTVRILPLAVRTGLSSRATGQAAEALRGTDSPSLWGGLLRYLSIHGHGQVVRAEVERRVLDPRAAVGALTDLGDRLPPALTAKAPATAVALRGAPAPAPTVESIL